MEWRQFVQALKQRVVPVLRELPLGVYAQLVVKWQEPHDTLARWRCILRKGEADGRRVTLIRIVDPEEVRRRGFYLRKYSDLNGRPEVIRYEGWLASSNEIHLTPVNSPKDALNSPGYLPTPQSRPDA